MLFGGIGFGLVMSRVCKVVPDGGGFDPSAPLAVSDFQNGVYTIGGVSKTFADMWEENLDNGPWHPETLVPGTGITTSTGMDSNGIGAAAALIAALDPALGITAVVDYSTNQGSSTALPRFSMDVLDTPDWNETWSYFQRGKDWTVLSDNMIWDQVAPAPDGDHMVALTLGPDFLAYSRNGGAAHVAEGIPLENPGANTIFVNVNVGGTGTLATVTLRSVTFYRQRAAEDLPALSTP